MHFTILALSTLVLAAPTGPNANAPQSYGILDIRSTVSTHIPTLRPMPHLWLTSNPTFRCAPRLNTTPTMPCAVFQQPHG